MARPSTVARLPRELRLAVDARIKDGAATLEELVEFVAAAGYDVSRSAMHRYRTVGRFADPAAEPILRPFIVHPYYGPPPRLPAGWPTPADTEQHWRLYGEAILLSLPHIPRMLPREAGAKPRVRVAARGVPADRPGPVPGIYVLGCIQL